MKDFNQDPDYYLHLKQAGVWYALVPEIHKENTNDNVVHRCVGCAFYHVPENQAASHCKISNIHSEFAKRGADCDQDDAFIFVDVSKWEQHIADRVAARLT
jgi:hypothetical protein